MPFDLINGPVVFQYMMNDIYWEHLDDFVVIYLDILIFSKNKEEHQKHICLVFEKIHKQGFYAKLEKCLFHKIKIEFLGFIVTMEGLKMDPKKVEAILS